jgi:hypothetical protein
MRVRARNESGASLIMALAVMLAMGVVVAALASYAQTNHRTTVSYRAIREQRYAGQAAIAQLVNWAKDDPAVGRDRDLPLTHPDCVTQLTQRIANQDRVVTASCEAERGSGSGQPADVGLTPPEGLVLLGTRQNQPGPYNAPPCTGWWDNIQNFFVNLFSYDNILQENDSLDIIRETSFRLKNRTATGTLNATCTSRDRGVRSTFKVSSDIVGAGDMWSNGYPVAAVDPDGDGPATARLIARGVCNLEGCIQGAAADAVQYERSGLTGAESYLNGSKRWQDPGRRWPKHPQDNPFGDIAEPWVSVAFNQDGTVRPLGYTATAIMPSRLPVRTTAYLRDPQTGALTPTGPGVCSASSSATIVFLPGWYQSAELLNSFTAHPSPCTDATLWFAPDPGPDGLLLTADDRTGGFYFDFRTGAAQNCNGLGNRQSRWCVGGSRTIADGFAAQSPRLVVGTPDGWTPRSVLGNGEVDPNTTFRVSINRANTIDLDLSQRWTNGANAATIDGQAASYSASVCIPFLNWCFSSDRAIRVRNFSPKVTGAPVELPGAPRGRIYVQVAYAVRNATSANAARAIIEAVSPESGRKACGTYTLFSDRTQTETGPTFEASDLKTYTFTDAQAKELADKCGSVDLINGLEVKIEIRGNNLNLPKTDWFLDGVAMFYDSYDGARFPAPTGATNPAAQRDCDPSKPGGQFIFGGEAHMYVADGSVEICAGPYPGANVDQKQSIGVWALPSVAEVRPIGSWRGPGTASLGNSGNVVDIDRQDVRINYNGCPFLGGNECDGVTRDARLDVRMNAYTAPPGYVIDRVTARFAYNARTACPPLFNVFCARPFFQIGSCAKTGANKTNGTLQFANIYPRLFVFDNATGVNCGGVTADRKTLPESYFYYHARCAFWCVGGNYDLFDGVRYQITLRPETTSAARLLPQTGCIVAWPNYAYGGGQPDCALIRADLTRNNDGWALPWNQKESGDSRGRISVKGTVYAPSSAMEVDDTDSAYPVATRGAVLRHLRISGFRFRQNYDAPAIDNRVDRTAARRETIMVACLQNSNRVNDREVCDEAAGDQILTRARVSFEVDASPGVEPERRARVPQVIAWSDKR